MAYIITGTGYAVVLAESVSVVMDPTISYSFEGFRPNARFPWCYVHMFGQKVFFYPQELFALNTDKAVYFSAKTKTRLFAVVFMYILANNNLH